MLLICQLKKYMDTLILINSEYTPSLLGIPIYIIIASILVPFIIFVMGYLFNNERDIRKENKNLRILEKFINLQLNELDKDLENDIENLSILIGKIKEEKHQSYIAKRSMDIHIDNVLSIDNTDLFKIYIYGRKENEDLKLESFDKILISLQNIKNTHYEMQNSFEEYFMPKLNKYVSEWNESMAVIFKNYKIFVAKNRIENIRKAEDDFISELDELLSSIQDAIKSGIYIISDNYLSKLRDFCNKFKNDDRNRIISDSVAELGKAYIEIKNLKKFILDLFDGYYNHFVSNKNIIKEVINRFNNMKIKQIRVKK